MDFQSIVEVPGGVLIKNLENFELKHIFDCGQCFRWNKEDNGNYIGVAFGRVLEAEQIGLDIMLYNTSVEEFYKIWLNYFDLDKDYSKIKNQLSEDELLNFTENLLKRFNIKGQKTLKSYLELLLESR